jgi:fructose 1,6-bisphosphatase
LGPTRYTAIVRIRKGSAIVR